MGDDVRRRIEELEASLASCRQENARLEAALEANSEPTGSPEPILTVDAEGTIVATNGAWFGGAPPSLVGTRLVALFTPESAAVVARCAEVGWLGASELRLALADGRKVGLAAIASREGHWLVGLHDLTVRHVLDDAMEQRRQLLLVSDLAGSLARELTDPMSIVQGRLELLLDLGVTDAESARRHLGVALEHARRVTASLRNLRLVGRTPLPSLEPVGVAEMLQESLDLLGPRRERVVVEVEPPDLQAGGSRAIFARVMASLIRSALEGAGRSSVVVTARRLRGQVALFIGPRGRPRGAVVGDHDELALDEALLNSVSGDLTIYRAGAEVHFEARLPLAPATRLRARPVESELLLVGNTVFHDAISSVLEKDGYAFHCVTSGSEAIALLDRQESTVDALVVELIQKAGPSGLALAERVVARYPQLEGRVLIVSQSRIESLPAPIVPVSWPLRRTELLEALGRRVRRR